jgi:integrase
VFGNAVGERIRSVRRAWDGTWERGGVVGLQLRDLRHEAGSRFDEAGVPINFVSRLLGHTNLTTTSRYLNIHRRGLHMAMQKLEESRRLANSLQDPAEQLPGEQPASGSNRSDKPSVS